MITSRTSPLTMDKTSAAPADQPVSVEAGELSTEEIHDLNTCEKAVDNLSTARWLAGKALQTIRDRKLHRHTHPTFAEYVQDRWEMSERAAYHAIEEWPLAEHLQLVLGTPTTPSHTRALLPVAHRFGLDPAADLYQQLRERAAADNLRLTAGLTTRIVQAVLKTAGTRAETPQFQEATRQLMSAEALPPAPSDTTANPSGQPGQEASASDHRRPDLQNSADVKGEGSATQADRTSEKLQAQPQESPAADDLVRSLHSILQMVQDVEKAINTLITVDPFLDGPTEALRQEIHHTLLRASAPYKPYRRRI